MISAKTSLLLGTCHGKDYFAIVPQEIRDDFVNHFVEIPLV